MHKTRTIHVSLLFSIVVLFFQICWPNYLEAGNGSDYVCSSCSFKTDVLHFGGGFEGGDYTYGYCYKCKEFSRINQESKETRIERIDERIEKLNKEMGSILKEEERLKYKKYIEECDKERKNIEQENRGVITCPNCEKNIKYYSCKKCGSTIIPFDFNKSICPRCGKKTFKRGNISVKWD
ncbi:MAG: hypothetical protein Q7K21_01425 [Elusimicrobiota bacterium]|nr:hypothetical protein [Elusimicrobiota bacterium]